jgi:hypothetical protein
MKEIDIYRVLMDERWELEDLYNFPHIYSQIHSFIYCLDFDLEKNKEQIIDDALSSYSWNGGYSYTNIYGVLDSSISKIDRPVIAEIKYASPGWIDLIMNPQVALQVAESVGIYMGMGVAAIESYKRIDKTRLDIAKNRKKHKVEMDKLSIEEIKKFNEMSEEIAKNLGFKSLKKLNKRINNPEVTLKLLLAHNRRIKKISKYILDGKAQLPIETKKKANKTE